MADSVEIHRAQGELNVLERLLGLEEELKNYGKSKLEAAVQENDRQRGEKEALNVG